MRLYNYEKKGLLVIALFAALTLLIPKLYSREEVSHFYFPVDYGKDTVIHPKRSVYRYSYGRKEYRCDTSRKIEIIELNAADSVTLVQVKGIGGYTAAKILRYRKQLGGYTDYSQLRELNMRYFETDSFRHILKVTPSLVSKRNLDTMEFKEVLRHPYLEYEDVKEIFNAKRRYGRVSFDTLHLHGILPLHKLQRIKPYFE